MVDRHSRSVLGSVVLVGLGGFVGGTLRFGVDLYAPGLLGTLVVNSLGSFALAVLLFAVPNRAPIGRRARLVVGTGVLSSFTTYSTFAVETIQAGGWLLVGNIFATYALGFAGVLAGLAIADVVDGGTSR